MNQKSSELVTCWIFTLFLFLPRIGMTQNNCELKKEKDNIRIYGCPNEASSFNTIRAEFEVNSTIEKYIEIVLDIENYKNWRYHEMNHRLLKRISDTELIYYNQVDAPFPVSDRDLVSHLTMSRDTIAKTLTVTIESMSDYIPPVDNMVRVPKSKSMITLTAMSESKLKAICIIDVDPGGQVPAWVINAFSTQAPYENFKNLIDRMLE
jgi:hypothetical protein